MIFFNCGLRNSPKVGSCSYSQLASYISNNEYNNIATINKSYKLYFIQLYKPKHLGCQVLATKKVLLKRHEIKMGSQRFPTFDKLMGFSHYDFTAKYCHFRCSRPPDVDKIKIFDKDNQAKNHKIKRTMSCSLVDFIKNFDPINIRSA